MDRISRDAMLMEIVNTVARRSTCERLHVGALIAKEGRIISIGYNGAPSGLPHCGEPFCDVSQPCTRTLHAESNAIAYAARVGIPTEGCSLYATDAPCVPCAKLIISAGIVEVVYERIYRDDGGLRLLHDAKVLARHFSQ